MKLLFKLTIGFCFVFVLLSSVTAAPVQKEPLKILFIVGGCCHDFKDLPVYLSSIIDKTGDFKVTKITEDRDELKAANINKYDVVMIYAQGSNLSPEQEKGITEFVANGKSLVGIHSGSDSFKNSDAYWKMLGGRFTGHGNGDWLIRITAKRHPIMKGIPNFRIRDEDYDNAIHPEAKILVLARWGNDGQPAVWVQEYGKGRVFYTGMGHGKDAFENPSFQEVVMRGLRWSVGWEPVKSAPVTEAKDLPNGGKPFIACETYSLRDDIGSGKISLEQVPALLKSLNIKGIVWNDSFFKSWDTSYFDTLKKAAADNGIITAGMIMEGNLAGDDDAAYKRQIEENKMKLKAAHYLGCPIVRMDIGGTGDDAKDGTIGIQRVIAAFNEMLPLAKQYNIKITIENHGGVSKKADWILAIINGTDAAWVGSCLDFGNWPDDVRYEETQKLANNTYHVHAKTYNFGPDGEQPRIDYGRVLGMMKAAKFNRAVSIEFEGAGDQVEGVKKSRDLIFKYWPELK